MAYGLFATNNNYLRHDNYDHDGDNVCIGKH